MSNSAIDSPVIPGHSTVRLDSQPTDAVFLRAAAQFFALGDPARLRLLAMLVTGERCVSELAEASGEEMSAVSQRLRLLRFHGLIARRRQGKHVYYALVDAHVAALITSGLQHAAEPRPPEPAI